MTIPQKKVRQIRSALLTSIIVCFYSPFLFAQEYLDQPSYEIHKVISTAEVAKEDILKANNWEMLLPHLKTEWIDSLVMLELITQENSKQKTLREKSLSLLPSQKAMMMNSDFDSEIEIEINYLPKNNLSSNAVQSMRFKITLAPHIAATPTNGLNSASRYFEETIDQLLPENVFPKHSLAAYQFEVSSIGLIRNPKIIFSSNSDIVDSLVMNSICDMDNWVPAISNSGQAVAQDYVLLLGDMESCMINLLDIEKKYLGQ